MIPGANVKVPAQTLGGAKFTVKLWYLKNILDNEKLKIIDGELSEYNLRINALNFSVNTTFFKTDTILRSIRLPVNYTVSDLTNLYLSGKYTEEELHFNGLSSDVIKAYKIVRRDIKSIIALCKQFNFKPAEVEALIKIKVAAKFAI